MYISKVEKVIMGEQKRIAELKVAKEKRIFNKTKDLLELFLVGQIMSTGTINFNKAHELAKEAANKLETLEETNETH